MKLIKTLPSMKFALCFALCAFLFASCTKDPVPPTLSVTPTQTEGRPGDTIDYVIKASLPSDLKTNIKTIKITVNHSGNINTLKDSNLTPSKNIEIKYRYIVPIADTGYIQLKFTVTDDKDNKNVYLGEISSLSSFVFYGVQCGGQSHGTLSALFTESSGQKYRPDEAKANPGLIDFCYFYDNTKKAGIASPDDPFMPSIDYSGTNTSQWSKRNHTSFRSIPTIKSFDDIKYTLRSAITLKSVYDAGTGETTIVPDLQVGQMMAFKTANGKHGVFRVLSVNPGSTGETNFNVAVQR